MVRLVSTRVQFQLNFIYLHSIFCHHYLRTTECFMLILRLVSKKERLHNFTILIQCFSLGYTAKENSFYASLHAEFTPQDQESSQTAMGASNSKIIEYRFVWLFLDNFLRIYYKNLKIKHLIFCRETKGNI